MFPVPTAPTTVQTTTTASLLTTSGVTTAALTSAAIATTTTGAATSSDALTTSYVTTSFRTTSASAGTANNMATTGPTMNSGSNSSSSSGSTVSCYSSYMTLSETLLNSSRYNPVMAPRSYASSSLTVYTAFLLIKFISLTSDTKVLTVDGALDMLWEDGQLTWDTDDYDCVTKMPFLASTVWNPYVYLKGAYGNVLRYKMDETDIIYKNPNTELSNGRIYGMFQSSCTLNLLYYPFDQQTCKLQFMNYDYTWLIWSTMKNNVVYQMSSDATLNGDWNVLDMFTNVTSANVCVASGCETLTVFFLNFELERKTNYYVMNLVAPTVIIWILIALTFVLPTDRGMKVPMTVTLMLTVYTQQKTISNLLPSASPIPYISHIYLVGLYLSAMSLVSAVLTVLMRVLAPALPHGAQRFLINVVGRLCCAAKLRVAPDDSSQKEEREDMLFRKQMLLNDLPKELSAVVSVLDGKLDSVDSHLRELIELKKAKTLKQQSSAANENVWQKIEFIFNAILLIAYVIVMATLFAYYSSSAGKSIL